MTIIKVSRKKYNQHFITHTVERKQIKAKPSYLSVTRWLMITLSTYFYRIFLFFDKLLKTTEAGD